MDTAPEIENTDKLARNKALIRRYLEAIPDLKLDVIAECLTPNVIQHYQRPTYRNDDGTAAQTANRGRDGILEEMGTYFYDRLYRKGTVRLTIERMIAEGDFVACQFILAATTTIKNEPYENFYHYMYRLENGKIAEYWEYVDSLYAEKMLFT